MTPKMIEAEHGLPLSFIYRRIYTLKLEGFRRGQNKWYTETQVKQILDYKSPEKRNKSKDKRKLACIEFYQKHGSYRKVAYMLNINREYVKAAVDEFLIDGCVTVESKMNNWTI